MGCLLRADQSRHGSLPLHEAQGIRVRRRNPPLRKIHSFRFPQAVKLFSQKSCAALQKRLFFRGECANILLI